MKRLFSYMKDYKLESILGPLFKMLEASFELFVPLVVARMVDVGIRGRDSGYILKMGGVLVLLALAIRKIVSDRIHHRSDCSTGVCSGDCAHCHMEH